MTDIYDIYCIPLSSFVVSKGAKTKPECFHKKLFFPQIFRSINTQVSLVDMEIWSDRDKIKVVPGISTTFRSFMRWHNSVLGKKKFHNHAQLLRWISSCQGRDAKADWMVISKVAWQEFLLSHISPLSCKWLDHCLLPLAMDPWIVWRSLSDQ